MGDVFDVKYFGIDPRTRKEKVSRKAILPKPEGYVARPPRENNDLVDVITEGEIIVDVIIDVTIEDQDKILKNLKKSLYIKVKRQMYFRRFFIIKMFILFINLFCIFI